MKGDNHPPCAQGEPAQPHRPRRIWDAVRKCWVEAMTVCRSARGIYVRKIGGLPEAQLRLPFEENDAA